MRNFTLQVIYFLLTLLNILELLGFLLDNSRKCVHLILYFIYIFVIYTPITDLLSHSKLIF